MKLLRLRLCDVGSVGRNRVESGSDLHSLRVEGPWICLTRSADWADDWIIIVAKSKVTEDAALFDLWDFGGGAKTLFIISYVTDGFWQLRRYPYLYCS